eukprot:Hpha_TRINITY_DN3093_c0_g1::TRINITY_DN3093_c0_g1_i1::g.138700::m.138700
MRWYTVWALIALGAQAQDPCLAYGAEWSGVQSATRNTCIAAFSTAKSWSAAGLECTTGKGGWLVTVDDSTVNTAVESKISDIVDPHNPITNPLNYSAVWIGLNDIVNETHLNGGSKDWVWNETDLTAVYRNWAVLQPNNNLVPPWGQDCVTMINTGVWNDRDCRESYPYVCQLPGVTVGPSTPPTSSAPTVSPSNRPSLRPTGRPTLEPTFTNPTVGPILHPSQLPTRTPTELPSRGSVPPTTPPIPPTTAPSRGSVPPTTPPSSSPALPPTRRPTSPPMGPREVRFGVEPAVLREAD